MEVFSSFLNRCWSLQRGNASRAGAARAQLAQVFGQLDQLIGGPKLPLHAVTERYNVALAPTNRILNVKPFMRHLRPLLALAACSAALSSGRRRPATPVARPTLSRKALLQAFVVTTLAPRRADAVDCLGEAEKAQRLIRTTLAIYADDGDPAPLRPVAKTIAKPDSPIKAVPGAGLLPPERPARRSDAQSCQRRPGVRGVRRRVRRL